jgi:hypothetical protein
VTADEYLEQVSAAMLPDAYPGDCLAHARAVAELLRAEGKQPWIGMLRKVEQREAGRFHAPLIPRRFSGCSVPAWTTHYVCCCDGLAYDPLLGRPEPLETYSTAVFGCEIPITESA